MLADFRGASHYGGVRFVFGIVQIVRRLERFMGDTGGVLDHTTHVLAVLSRVLLEATCSYP